MGEELPAAMRKVEIAQQTWNPIMEDMADLIENVMEAMSGLIEKMNEYNDIDLKPLDIPDSSGLSSRYTAAVATSSSGSSSGGDSGGGGSFSNGYNVLQSRTIKTPWEGGGTITK
jgi:uncharacterized membrane protein YgcG